MKKKMMVIVNPISGIGRQKRIERVLKENLDLDLFDYQIRYTEKIHHGKELAREAADMGFDVVVAVGGDGSVNDAIAGLHGSDTTLAIIPCGSGNGLARCMRLPLIPALAVRVINQYNESRIDTISLNEKFVVASIAGVGFDAHIARMMQAAKTRGLPAYLNFIMHEYPTYKARDYRMVVDGKEITRNAWFSTFANSNQFGYNFAIAPMAKLDDGLIDITIMDKIPLEHVALTTPLIYANHAELSQHVEIFRAKEIDVYGNIDKYVNIDGEAEYAGEELHFVNRHRDLKILKRDMSIPLIVKKKEDLITEKIKSQAAVVINKINEKR